MANFNHEEYQSKVTAVVVLFVIYDILGFCGNILVLFIYGTRYPKNRFRLLVLALSAVDFTSCCTTVPLETVSTYLYFDPPSRGLCKAKNFFVQLTGLSAMYMLFVTAVYKYRQICRPFKKQLTPKFIIMLCCSGIVSSLICAIPAGILWDINNHNDTLDNKTDFARICEVHEKYHGTIVPQMYRHLLSAYDVFLLATIVLYFFVAKKTFAHYRRMKRNVNKSIQDALKRSHSFVSKSSSDKLCSDGSTTEKTDISGNSVSESNETSSVRKPTDEALSDSNATDDDKHHTMNELSPSDSNDPASAKRKTIQNQQRPIDIRKVLIMVIIAGTFSVTFLMALAFGYVFAIFDLQDYGSVDEYIALFTCYRLYFINYCLNPTVYFAFDRRFRDEVIKLLTCSTCRPS